MKTSGKVTLIASLIGSAFGTGLWLFGIAALIWPAHPQLAVLLLTVICTIAVMQMWPEGASPDGQKRLTDIRR